MNRLLPMITFVILSHNTTAQELKPKKGKTLIYVEEYNIMADNKKVRQGPYKIYTTDGSQIWTGQIETNARVGKWQYYENGELHHTFDFNENQAEYHGSRQLNFVKVNGQVETLILDTPPMYTGGKIGLTDELNRVLPYPMHARRMGIEGRVTVEVWVNEDGTLGDITLVKGIMTECDDALIDALRKVRRYWIPGTLDDQDVTAKLILNVDYQLHYIFEDKAVTVM